MGHPGFRHWQTSNSNPVLPGGKLGLFVHAKRANCTFIHGCIFVQWTNFGRVTVPKTLTFSKSFETGTYNNRKNTSATNPTIQSDLKIYPLDKSTAPEGFSEKFIQWLNHSSNSISIEQILVMRYNLRLALCFRPSILLDPQAIADENQRIKAKPSRAHQRGTDQRCG